MSNEISQKQPLKSHAALHENCLEKKSYEEMH